MKTATKNEIYRISVHTTALVHGIRLLCVAITEYHIRSLSLHINDVTDGWFAIFGESCERVMHDGRKIVRYTIIHHFSVPFSFFKRTGETYEKSH